MLTERTKIESDIDDIVSANLNGSILSVVLKQAPVGPSSLTHCV